MSHFLDRLNYFSNPKESFSGDHGVTTGEDRTWEDAYRNRWAHDLVVRPAVAVGVFPGAVFAGGDTVVAGEAFFRVREIVQSIKKVTHGLLLSVARRIKNRGWRIDGRRR